MLIAILLAVGAGLIIVTFKARSMRSSQPPVEPSTILGSCRNVRLRKTKWTSIRGDLYVTSEQLLFQTNLGLVPMSYDAHQLRSWNRSASNIDLSVYGTVVITSEFDSAVIEEVSGLCFQLLVQHSNRST